jgi:uncharacterized 2Fe-2S/4Fe-4S cluster protein (DUF4445 family)
MNEGASLSLPPRILAYLILILDRNRKTVDERPAKMTYVELNTEPSYMNEYTRALFPSIKPLISP